MRKICLGLAACLCCCPLHAGNVTANGKDWEMAVSDNGCLEHIVYFRDGRRDTVSFFCPESRHAGPSFYAVTDGREQSAAWSSAGHLSYRAEIGDVECRMTYMEWKGCPAVEVTLYNSGHVPFQPEKAGLRLGIDTYMDRYPEWFGKYFPTLMRGEKTHFYGYLQTPGGRMLAVVSPQPVASWSVEYNLGYQDPAPHWFMGHRIESLNLDLLNALPLPERHPHHLWKLEQGESRTWIVAFADIDRAEQFENTVRLLSGAPVLRMERTACRPGDSISFEVLADNPEITVSGERGDRLGITAEKTGRGVYAVSCVLPGPGLYTVRVTDAGKQAEGILTAWHPRRRVMEAARANALKYKQKATSHVESWYGFYSAFIAARHFSDPGTDSLLSRRFDCLFGMLHDTVKMEPKYFASRIQNTSGTVNILTDKYLAEGNPGDLKKACALADWLIRSWQREDGAYVNHDIVYTSVIYVAKNILELALAEKELGKTDPVWEEAAERHFASAKKAVDQLVASQGDFETEGQMTFEDGMISCSALQIGMMGLMHPEGEARRHYTEAMLRILDSHDCLAQLRVPDARRRGGTMRFWEAQYDVQMLPNMFNSPHGWSAWRAYATYYAYLLTGEERWLLETFNAIGAFSNLIDWNTGNLRWAFVADPYLKVRQTCRADTRFTADSLSFGNPHPDLYETRSFIIGEQYVNMVSDWQGVNTQDNDVHEVFKCIGETVLTNAFVIEREDGTVAGYNCRVSRRGDVLFVEPDEEQMTSLHCNFRNPHRVSFLGKTIKTGPGYAGWAFGRDPYIFRR